MKMDPAPDTKILKTSAKWICFAFLGIALFFLVSEHRAHLFGILPYLLLLACPLMHLFMHHGHGHNRGDSGPSQGQSGSHNRFSNPGGRHES